MTGEDVRAYAVSIIIMVGFWLGYWRGFKAGASRAGSMGRTKT